MKNFTKISLYSILIGLIVILLSIGNIYAVGTTAGTLITNSVTVSGDNVTPDTVGWGTNVLPIVGGHWTSPDLDEAGASAGMAYTNHTRFSNLGNSDFTFAIKVTNSDNDGGTTVPWTWSVYTNDNLALAASTGTSNGTSFNMNIAEGASKTVYLVVTVDGSATSEWEEWSLLARTADSKENTVNYTGDNGTVYGGPLGEGWADYFTDALTSYGQGGTPEVWRVSCNAPLITISKTIQSIASTAGINNVAIPGATITYLITVSNAAAGGNANGLRIVDTIDDTDTEFVSGSEAIAGPGTWVTTHGTNVSGETNTIQWSNTAAYAGGSNTEFTFDVTIR